MGTNDVHYRVYALRFLFNHGDTLGVKGGDGIIGAIGPIMRGEAAAGDRMQAGKPIVHLDAWDGL
jgi:hypothetical protein